MEKNRNMMGLLRRYQRFVDFDAKGRPLHPLSDTGLPLADPEEGTTDGARFQGLAIVINDNKEVLLQYDKSRGEWKLLATAYTSTKNHALKLLDKLGATGQTIYSNMNNFDGQQSRHNWTESIVKRCPANGYRKHGCQWFAKGALPDNIRLFDSIMLNIAMK